MAIAKLPRKLVYRKTTFFTCKVLLNKDHATCGKERFIRIQIAGLPGGGGAAAWLK
jgi:hypothetical protein